MNKEPRNNRNHKPIIKQTFHEKLKNAVNTFPFKVI